MERTNLSLTLMIPNVSLLLVFKDNWSEIKIMRKVIAELLRNGFYKEIQTVDKGELQCNRLLGLEDCAIISLHLSGGPFTADEVKNPKIIFAQALTNVRNVVRFDFALLSELHKVSYIEFGLKLCKSEDLTVPISDINAA